MTLQSKIHYFNFSIPALPLWRSSREQQELKLEFALEIKAQKITFTKVNLSGNKHSLSL